MSFLLERQMKLQEIALEPFLSLDAQGKPTYGEAQTLQARCAWESALVRRPDGSRTPVDLLVWVPGSSQLTPVIQDRLVVDGIRVIVVDQKQTRSLQSGVVDHTRCACTKE